MTAVLDDLPALKRKLESFQKKHYQAKAVLDQLMLRLKKEFGCDTIDQAKVKLEELKKKERILTKKYVKAKAAFEKKWKEFL